MSSALWVDYTRVASSSMTDGRGQGGVTSPRCRIAVFFVLVCRATSSPICLENRSFAQVRFRNMMTDLQNRVFRFSLFPVFCGDF